MTQGELGRKLVHVAVGGFAFLLRFLSWPQAALMALAAFLFNWQLLPRLGGRRLWRGEELAKGYPLGILIYPLSVLGLILAFRQELWIVASVWGMLAFGDGAASIFGLALGGPRLPWNRGKSWAGFLAFIVCGALGSSVLMAWTLRLPIGACWSPRILGLALPLAAACALVESAHTTLDDNLTVPLAGGILLPLLALVEMRPLLEDPQLAWRLLLGLVLNGGFALLARVLGSIDGPGALSAVLIGTAITVGLGVPGLAVMVGFFVLGSAVTRLGYRVKAARGIAQEKGGARGWRNAWANGGIPAFLALMAALVPSSLHELFVLAYAASVATATADTCSSEVGKAYGRRTFLITTLRPVPPGTEGAVSLEGTLAGLAGGASSAAVGAAAGLVSWPSVPLIALAGLLGSLGESVMGTVAERRGWLDNDQLNAVNTALGAGIVVLLAAALPGIRVVP